MKRILSVILALMVVMSCFAVSPSAVASEKEFFNADVEAYYDGWFYYANEGKVYRETNTGESRTYYSDNAEKIGVSQGKIYILREDGISRYDISEKKETKLVSVNNIERFSLSDRILYYLVNGTVVSENLSSGETKEFIKANDFWLEDAENLSYMVDDDYIYTVNFASGAVEKNINNASYFSEDLTVSSGVAAGSHFGNAPQKISIKKLRDKFPAGKYWNHGSGSNNPDGYTSSGCYHHDSSGCEYNGSCGCNSFNSAIQCMGYAEKCGRDVTDANPRTSSEWKQSYNSSDLDNLKAGDIIRYKNNGHSIYVIGVRGDTVTITDCNSDYHCKIRWDATLSKSTIKSTFTYIRIAPFDAGVYTMKLNACGGSCSKASIEVINDEAYGELPVPTRDGYNFTGWYSADNGGTKITATSTVNLDSVSELYAHWELKTYTITYDANGGEKAPDAQTKTHFTSLVLSSGSPTRYGYSFDSWNTAPDGSGTSYSRSARYKEEASVTLYAQWTPKTNIRVTFNSNGGSNPDLGRNVTFGRKYSEEKSINGYSINKLPVPQKDGYDFDGWYLDKNGGGLVTDDTPVGIAEYHTLYAHWTEKKYLISYDGRGDGSWPENQYKYHLSSVRLSDVVPTSTGMTFKSWNTGENGNGVTYYPGETYSTNSPLVLYAQWDREKFNVTYNANGGSGAPESQIKEYGLNLTLSSTVPTRTGYSFSGWSDGNGNTYNPSDTYKKNTALHLSAKWSPNKYMITFDYQDGACETREKEVTFDGAYGSLPESSKAGYVFKGWYTEKTGGTRIASDDIVKITVNTVLYAHWELKTYDVTFASQGTGVPAVQKKNHGTDLKLTTSVPSRTGFEFVEWNTSEDGSGEAFASGGIYYKDAPITLYAIWKNAEYTVSYDANGGTNAPATQKKLYGTNIYVTSVVPEKTGYNFIGWNTAKDGNGVDYAGGAVYSANCSETLFAKWEAKKFKANLNCDEEISTYTLVYGQKYGEMPKPEKDGFTFLCWADKDGKTINPNGVFAGNRDIDLYASWLNNKDLVSGETYYAAFVDNGKVVAKVPYSSSTQSIQEPVLADIYGYLAEWEDYSLEEGGIVVFSVRTPIEYDAKFTADGKTISTVKYTVEDYEIEEPDIPEKTGYSAKWSSYVLGGNIEIKAVYTVIEYEAKFFAKGSLVSTVKYTVGSKSIATPRIPDRAGYSGKWEDFKIVAGGLNINAIYSMNRYIADFVAEGTEIGSSSFTIDSDKIYEPEVPMKNGYSGRWEDYNFSSGNITVNAIYTPNDYYVTFRASGSVVERVKYTYGATSISVPEIPEKAGYTARWGNYSLGYSDSSVDAIYTPIRYTATFVADGVTVGTETFTVETYTLYPPIAPEKEGYTVKWANYEIGPHDMTIEAVYTLFQDIGIRGYKETRYVDYKTTIIFTAEPVGMTDEFEVHWFLNGEDKGEGDADGKFEVYRATGNYSVQAKMIEKASGNVIAESETEKIRIYGNLLHRLIAFFKMLFGLLPVIEQ